MPNNQRNADRVFQRIQVTIDKDLVEPAVNATFNEMVNNSPVASGRLQASWIKTKIQDGQYRIRNTVNYISYVINGTANRLPNMWTDNALLRHLGVSRPRN